MTFPPPSQLLAALTLCVAFVTGCKPSDSSADGKTEWVDPKMIEAGPIRHASLTEDQISRITRVQKIFSEVDPSPVEKWVEDFRRDANLERELAVWEDMATAYDTFTRSNTLTLGGKKEAFQVVLLRSGAPEDQVLKHLELKILTEKDARAIMALFANKPAPIRVVSP